MNASTAASSGRILKITNGDMAFFGGSVFQLFGMFSRIFASAASPWRGFHFVAIPAESQLGGAPPTLEVKQNFFTYGYKKQPRVTKTLLPVRFPSAPPVNAIMQA
jgi:hypothetical protein